MGDELKKLYSMALNKLTHKDLSVYQMKLYLSEKCSDEMLINEVISLLLERKFLDDQRLSEEVVSRLRAKGFGKYRIEKSLESYQFDRYLIELHLKHVSQKSQSDLEEILQKIDASIYRGPKILVLKKIQGKLIRKGFSMSQVTSCVTSDIIDYDEFESCLSDTDKLAKKIKDDVSLKNKLYQKGYHNSTIQQVLERRRVNENK